MSDGVDALMDAVQTTGGNTSVDARRADAEIGELPQRHNPVLPLSKLRNKPIRCSPSGLVGRIPSV